MRAVTNAAFSAELWLITSLTRYCDHPDLSIDNNHTERSLRGWAVGRNNWTSFGSDREVASRPCCAASQRRANG